MEASGDMAFQYIRPDADAIDGNWTTDTGSTTLFSSIDETVADDNDFIISSNNPNHDICKIRLSDPGAMSMQPCTVRYRYGKRGEASFSLDLTVSLLQGVTVIASWTHTDVGTTFVLAEQLLTTPQFNAITDFTDLFLQFDPVSGAPGNAFVAEDGTTNYVAEDGTTYYVQE